MRAESSKINKAGVQIGPQLPTHSNPFWVGLINLIEGGLDDRVGSWNMDRIMARFQLNPTTIL